jgi:hypothetical protein
VSAVQTAPGHAEHPTPPKEIGMSEPSHLWYEAYTFARVSLGWGPAASREYANTYEANVTNK